MKKVLIAVLTLTMLLAGDCGKRYCREELLQDLQYAL